MKNILTVVKWADSASTQGWVASKDIATACGVATCLSAGFLVSESDTEILLARDASADGSSSPFGEIIAIPARSVIEKQVFHGWDERTQACRND